MPGLGRAVRAEFLKFFTTRLWWGMGIGVFLSAAAFSVLFGILLTLDSTQTGGAGVRRPGTPPRSPTRSTPRASASATC